MKKFIVAGIAAAAFCGAPALAADMPVKAPYAAPVFNWTGFYIGAHAGYAWGRVTGTTNTAASTPPTASALSAGQIRDRSAASSSASPTGIRKVAKKIP